MARIAIDIDRQRVTEFCARHHIRRLALFGSVLRRDFGPGSDVDVLVEFAPGQTPGFAFFAIQEDPWRARSRARERRFPRARGDRPVRRWT